MAESPRQSMPYVMAMLVLFLLGVVFVGMILWLRPTVDPLIVVAAVMGFVVSIGTGIAAFMKSQETHLMVNSQLDAWKKEFFELAHAKGVIVGADGEQKRVAELQRVAALTPVKQSIETVVVSPTLVPTVPTPVPVIVANPKAIPVKDVGRTET